MLILANIQKTKKLTTQLQFLPSFSQHYIFFLSLGIKFAVDFLVHGP